MGSVRSCRVLKSPIESFIKLCRVYLTGNALENVILMISTPPTPLKSKSLVNSRGRHKYQQHSLNDAPDIISNNNRNTEHTHHKPARKHKLISETTLVANFNYTDHLHSRKYTGKKYLQPGRKQQEKLTFWCNPKRG